jgi:hypothetical protein
LSLSDFSETQRAQLISYASNPPSMEECTLLITLAKPGETRRPLRWHSRIVHDSLEPGPIGKGSFRVTYGHAEQLEAFAPHLAETGILLLEQVFNPNELALLSREEFWNWANEIQEVYEQAVAVIPYFPGSEADNWKEASFALRTPLTDFNDRTMFVWHFSDSDESLVRATRLFNYLALHADAAFDPRRWPERCLKRLRTANGIINRVERKYRRRPFVHLRGALGGLHKLTRYDGADAPKVDASAWPADELTAFLALAQRRLRNRRWGRKGPTTNFDG